MEVGPACVHCLTVQAEEGRSTLTSELEAARAEASAARGAARSAEELAERRGQELRKLQQTAQVSSGARAVLWQRHKRDEIEAAADGAGETAYCLENNGQCDRSVM
jgi:hypothetical protein